MDRKHFQKSKTVKRSRASDEDEHVIDKVVKKKDKGDDEPQDEAFNDDNDGDIENDDSIESDEELDSDGYDEDGNETTTNDGLSVMMSKILNQNITKNPILAKRKTAAMKEIEENHFKKEESKIQRIERKKKREMFLVPPNPLSSDFERQLRKVATKGVVSLFNAINNAKKEAEEASQTAEDKNGDESTSAQTEKPTLTKVAHKKTKPVNEDSTNAPAVPVKSITAPVIAKKWSVLRDDSLSQTKLSMKNWDRDSSEDEDVADF